jgi:hypothetical protein
MKQKGQAPFGELSFPFKLEVPSDLHPSFIFAGPGKCYSLHYYLKVQFVPQEGGGWKPEEFGGWTKKALEISAYSLV